MTELEKELRESVAYFEQILHVLPGDRTALEFLCMAYEQLGEREKFLVAALELANVILREKNAESAAALIERLKAVDDPRAQAVLLKLQVLCAPEPELKFERPELRETCATPARAAKAELDLLNRLVAEGVLTASLVQTAFDQLEHLPSANGEFLISALAILEKENLAGAADAAAAVADLALAPPVPLEAFDLSRASLATLPEKLVRVRGVVPFAQLGREWAVALANPLDEALRTEVTALLGAKCHFFLAHPATIERVLENIFKEDELAEPPAPTPAASVPTPAAPAADEPTPAAPVPRAETPTPEAEPVADTPPPIADPLAARL